MTSDAIQQSPQPIRIATKEEIEAVEWAADIRRRQLGILGDAMQRLVVLETAVLGGSAALLNQVPAPPACKSLAVVLLLGSLALSLIGVNPLTGRYRSNRPQEIIEARDRGARWRSRLLLWSCGLLFAAFAVIVGGIVGSPSKCP